ncbi:MULTISPECIES: DUF3572 domain-containing protein [Thalassospira]|jgi:hypothetical protein|uniref:DUF3572 domain-containing protein n=1 Tax=Thalassospira TaxID=168934 RepID=UPI000D768DC4|nr:MULTISPECIES: DUF3572 domain-containing protein [Thalassospira]MBL4842828.1 DUF3572 domain-containing protein [Thalassospira sp.]PXX34438.1 uncharacterized protein DUF3572 [Thalassospira sp. 11-3]RCK42136.1 hypothetical protein TH24_02320 [Thalassospira xiamenensis]
MNKEAAETLAIRAIAHIAGDDELLEGLFAQTGMGLDDLKAGITSNEVQLGAIDFLMSHEPFLMRFAEDSGYAPEDPARAQVILSGGPIWQD